jgi:hypothetical protein
MRLHTSQYSLSTVRTRLALSWLRWKVQAWRTWVCDVGATRGLPSRFSVFGWDTQWLVYAMASVKAAMYWGILTTRKYLCSLFMQKVWKQRLLTVQLDVKSNDIWWDPFCYLSKSLSYVKVLWDLELISMSFGLEFSNIRLGPVECIAVNVWFFFRQGIPFVLKRTSK